jgi:Thiol:disulfide interchange protein DsbD, N-terminal
MKKLFSLLAGIGLAFMVNGQQSPVSWTFTAKKIDEKTFEVHMTASVQSGWHLYSQIQPDDAVVNPTNFKFSNNPLLTLDGKTRELGKMEKFRDEKLDISANQYSNKVDFVQLVKLKTRIKTSLVGTVEFQTCDDKKCLPPKTIDFNISIQ